MGFSKSYKNFSSQFGKMNQGPGKLMKIGEPENEIAPKPVSLNVLPSAENYDPLKSKYSRLQAQFRKRF